MIYDDNLSEIFDFDTFVIVLTKNIVKIIWKVAGINGILAYSSEEFRCIEFNGLLYYYINCCRWYHVRRINGLGGGGVIHGCENIPDDPLVLLYRLGIKSLDKSNLGRKLYIKVSGITRTVIFNDILAVVDH